MLGFLIGMLSMFAFGGMLLIVILGARRIEGELKQRAEEIGRARAEAARIPRFFLVTRPASPAAGAVDEAFLWQLQQYLKAEQTFAEEFVSQPSIESLYRDSGMTLRTH